MEILRTPDERFTRLPGFDFSPHYVQVNGLRMHYIDEGPATGETVLLLHGEPSWCYLYRKMIPIITAAGLRAVAPDLIGFGRSDKLANTSDYSYQMHVDSMAAFLDALDLRRITLFCQDWGGLIGLRLAAEHPQRFERIVAANTYLPTGDQTMPKAFLVWQKMSQRHAELKIGDVIKNGCKTELPAEVITAYEAPFPDERYKAGARVFPLLVPTRPDDPASAPNRAAWKVLRQWQKPFLTLFSDGDPITRGADLVLQKRIPGARGQPHTTITGAGHFLQEDKGVEIAAHLVDFIDKTRIAL